MRLLSSSKKSPEVSSSDALLLAMLAPVWRSSGTTCFPFVAGMDHLLPTGNMDKSNTPKTPSSFSDNELQVACFMGLVSVLASTPEVLRVSPYHAKSGLNAVAASVTETASSDISQTPLRNAGLDGSGEVIQVFSNRFILRL